MTQEPLDFEQHRSRAEKYLSKGLVKSVQFSGGTYQIQVLDFESGKELWPFLQLDSEGKIKDALCSCEEAEEGAYCEHLAAAWLTVYNHQSTPLHIRFEYSLWNRLCSLYGSRLGYEVTVLKNISLGSYVWESVSGRQIFTLSGTTKETSARLTEMIDERPFETEETSLKFSNISQEQIALWREGRPDAALRYELSFWSDLAKWLFLMQDAKVPYKIHFDYSQEEIPNQIHVEFPGLKVSFYLSEANLPEIIPSLATVESPLAVYNWEDEAIDKIVYHKETSSLRIIPKKSVGDTAKQDVRSERKGAGRIGEWLYVPREGFYRPEQNVLLERSEIPTAEVGAFLSEHREMAEKFLRGTPLRPTPVKISYEMHFDSQWNLNFQGYLFEPRDLKALHSHYFGSWAYLDDDGFYRLEGALFDTADQKIPSEQVSDFIHRKRSWLNAQEGYRTHLASVEALLIYNLSDDNILSFESHVDMAGEPAESHDFGDWIYIAEQGFYSKMRGRIGIPVRGGIEVRREEIPSFIRMNRDDLEQVKGFFSPTCPVVKSGLKVELASPESVRISPEYELLPSYRDKKVRFFENFIFIPERGFCELPIEFRLPDRFRRVVELQGEEMHLFLAYELETLGELITYLDPRIGKVERLRLSLQHIEDKDSPDSREVSLDLSYDTGKGTVSVVDLWKALKKRRRYFFSFAGRIDLHDERLHWLHQIPKQHVDVNQKQIKLSLLEFIRLEALQDVKERLPEGREEAKGEILLHTLHALKAVDPCDISGLKSHLRPYQETGVHWLWFLYCNQLSGLLCDDMGLGKTHQAMALLASVSNKHKSRAEEKTLRYLIVCPTSVIYHWQDKLRSFLPEMRLHTFYGVQRNLDEFADCDVLLTSYGVLRSERSKLSKIPFELAIFDEIQVAKNHLSQTHAALAAIQAKMRLGLTGTPIENNLRELKSLFDLVLPTYMPRDAQFRDFFVNPIEKFQDASRKEALARFIKPFVLRRKKGDVLQELPEKTVEKAYCQLSAQQKTMYADILAGSRDQLLRDLEDEKKPVPYMHLFAILTALKQVCDHPAIIQKEAALYGKYQSGKWDLFVELLNQARESQQKVVVFSHYLTMMDIIENYLTELNISFASIRGSTVRRDQELRRFAEDPKCEVFIGSLQAAGLGVDLTSASIVIHYDRWWTAAREDQATDRVHRIGQTRGVQVFKLITQNTLEEKIDQLIDKKGRLMDEIIGTDDQSQLKTFDRKDLISLLQFVQDQTGQSPSS